MPGDDDKTASAVTAELNREGTNCSSAFSDASSSTSSTELLPHLLRPSKDSAAASSTTPDPSSPAEVVTAFKHSPLRLILLDYDGTLTPLIDDPSLALLTDRQKMVLASLSDLPETGVCIISGRGKAFLKSELAKQCPNIGLYAGHGTFERPIGSKKWCLSKNVIPPGGKDGARHAWLEWAHKVFASLTLLVRDSWVEYKTLGCVWHYRKNQADGEIIAGPVMELMTKISEREEDDPLMQFQVMKAKDAIDIRPAHVGKGVVVTDLLKSDNDSQASRFIFCAGDDATDEDMFAVIDNARVPDNAKFTTKVFNAAAEHTTATKAKWRVDEPADIWKALEGFLEAEGVVVEE